MAETVRIPKAPTVEETITRMNSKDPKLLKPDNIRSHFSDVLEDVYYAVRQGYLALERQETDRLRDKFMKLLTVGDDRETVRRNFYYMIMEGIKLESVLLPIRMSRAKGRFEETVQILFGLAGIPNERVSYTDKRNGMGRIDLIVPDKRTFTDGPGRAHLLYLEAALKGRWNRIVRENGSRQGACLVTILRNGESISKPAVQAITESGMLLYLPDRIKKERFPGEDRIRKLSDLPSDLQVS